MICSTPLASIEQCATALLQTPDHGEQAARRSLATTILQESQQMGRQVANLLDMMRVESGALGAEGMAVVV